MRKISLETGEIYHVFNRGIDKRRIFQDINDTERLLASIREFNTVVPIGSMYERMLESRNKKIGNLVPKKARSAAKLVEIICYCLLPNHFHIVLRQAHDKGTEKFMHRLGVGYTNYFNEKYRRSGSLFQGTYKANHVDTNEYLLQVCAYVNLNDRVHKKYRADSRFIRSSWKFFLEGRHDHFIHSDIVLDQFKKAGEYEKFALDALKAIRDRREMEAVLAEDLGSEDLGT